MSDHRVVIADEQTTRLVLSAQAGNTGALGELCTRYLPRIRQIVALKLGRSRRQMQENEDLVQDAFVKILGSLNTYQKLSTARFYHWVARCVVNLIRDSLRKQKLRGTEQSLQGPSSDLIRSSMRLLDPGHELTPSRGLEGEEFADLVERALLRLPEHQRELIGLRCFCEMSYDEIAETLGFERKDTVRVSLLRARQRLKDELGRLTASDSRD